MTLALFVWFECLVRNSYVSPDIWGWRSGQLSQSRRYSFIAELLEMITLQQRSAPRWTAVFLLWTALCSLFLPAGMYLNACGAPTAKQALFTLYACEFIC